MDDTKAIESLTREMELARNEMAALTDAVNRLNHTMEGTTTETSHRVRIAFCVSDDELREGLTRLVRFAESKRSNERVARTG